MKKNPGKNLQKQDRVSNRWAGKLITPGAGEHTLREIFAQPEKWVGTARRLEQARALQRIVGCFSSHEPWLFVGCGSSYYLAQLVAAVWRKEFLIPCSVVPASELLFAPEEILRRTGARQAVLVSRSGETTEVLRAGTLLQGHPEISTLGVTCNAGGALGNYCKEMLRLTWVDEKSVVMTQSFTAMLLAFEELGALLSGDTRPAVLLDALAKKAGTWLEENAGKIQALAAMRKFADFVFLGQGAHYWLAQEAGLKITEMSSSYAQAYHTLEFRHGPKSIASRETLVTFIVSEAAAEEEALLMRELKELGATIFVVANRATPAMKEHSDLCVELRMDVPEFARLALTAIPAQLLGAAVGLRKGLNPDAPMNLTRAVVLGSNGNVPGKRRNA